MTIADQILSHPAYESCKWFTASQIADDLGMRRESVRVAMWKLVQQDKLEVHQRRKFRPSQYRKVVRHWIHARPLADTSWMEAWV